MNIAQLWFNFDFLSIGKVWLQFITLKNVHGPDNRKR